MHKAKVESLTEDRLRCFYSRIEELTAVSKEDALAFHWVVDGIFQQTAVIPIRFPTLLNGEEDLRLFLRKQGAQYSAALARLQDSIQMELLVSVSPVPAPPAPASGKAYLQERGRTAQSLAAAAEAAHARIQHLAAGWQTRPGKQRDTIRCYALIARAAEKDFRRQIESMPALGSVKIALSGPWPCTEFLE